MRPVRRVAVVGGGISGLVAAYMLSDRAEVVLYEAAPRLGGHAHTVDAAFGGKTLAVDTAVVVINDRTYPLFLRLLKHLEIDLVRTNMALSVRDDVRRVEFATHDPGSFSQLWRKSFTRLPYQLMWDLPRFSRAAKRYQNDPTTSLGEVLDRHGFGEALTEHVVLPLTATVWSIDFQKCREMPFSAWWRFVCNHGLATPRDLPKWYAFPSGTRAYVDKLAQILGARVRLSSPVTKIRRTSEAMWVTVNGGEPERFDEVVCALHADIAARVIEGATDAEMSALRSIGFEANDVVLHGDASVLPKRKKAWSSWNFHMHEQGNGAATVTYHMNQLQSLPVEEPALVSLNQTRFIDPASVRGRFTYDHPRYNAVSLPATQRLLELSGRDRLHFAGAYLGIGFHEDGVRSAAQIAERLGVEARYLQAA